LTRVQKAPERTGEKRGSGKYLVFVKEAKNSLQGMERSKKRRCHWWEVHSPNSVSKDTPFWGSGRDTQNVQREKACFRK